MIVLTLARKPCSEGSVAVNVLKHGTGGINIEGTRLAGPGWSKQDQAVGGGFKTGKFLGSMGNGESTQQYGLRESSTGRFPTNLIFGHLPGCKQIGTRQIRTNWSARGTKGMSARQVFGDLDTGRLGSRVLKHCDANGNEQIPVWDCAAGCPVADLDNQSGCSISTVRKGGVGDKMGTGRESWRFRRQEGGFEDTGGASRFFKQTGGKQE